MSDVSIFISLGGGKDFGITQSGGLVLQYEGGRKQLDLGTATVKRISNLQEYLERLKVHAVDSEYAIKP